MSYPGSTYRRPCAPPPPPQGWEGAGVRGDRMSRARVLREFWEFLRLQKKYWLAPIVLVLALLGLLLVFAQTSAVGPFIYTLF